MRASVRWNESMSHVVMYLVLLRLAWFERNSIVTRWITICVICLRVHKKHPRWRSRRISHDADNIIRNTENWIEMNKRKLQRQRAHSTNTHTQTNSNSTEWYTFEKDVPRMCAMCVLTLFMRWIRLRWRKTMKMKAQQKKDSVTFAIRFEYEDCGREQMCVP